MNPQLTTLEHEVLEMMLGGENPELKVLREQLSQATVLDRKLTGHGFFTNFGIPSSAARLQRKSRMTITDVSAEMPELKRGAGFVLFVDAGAMACLEGFSYEDETWPDSTASFALSYLQESPRGSGSLHPSKHRDLAFALRDFQRKD